MNAKETATKFWKEYCALCDKYQCEIAAFNNGEYIVLMDDDSRFFLRDLVPAHDKG